VVMDGATTTLKVAHVRLCHSRMMFVRAYPRETQEMVFDAHDGRRRVLQGCVHARGIYDNMKTAVEDDLRGQGATIHRASCKCAHTTSSIPSPARRPRAGKKARWRTMVGLVRERFFTPRLRFKSYDELNA